MQLLSLMLMLNHGQGTEQGGFSISFNGYLYR